MFTYEDLLKQFRLMRKMGPFQNVVKMLPGVAETIPKETLNAMDDAHVSRIEAMVLSMTLQERRLRVPLSSSRRRRIARGSGMTELDVHRLETQMGDMRRNMRQSRWWRNDEDDQD